MAETDVRKMSLFKLGWPIFFQCLLSLCLGYIDMFMITGYDENAVNGIGQANQILGFLTLAFTIISSAAGVMIAQYLGAKLRDKLNEIYTVSIFFNLILSGVISFILLAGANFIFKLMKTPSFMIADARNYMTIVGGFMFIQAMIDVFSQVFRNNGKTQFGMFIAISMNIINIVGNYIFLYGPLKHLELGVRGVAISTVLSRLIALVVAILLFKYKIEGHISIKYLWPFPKEILKKLLKLGIPTAGENISYNIAQIIILIMVNTFDSKVVSSTKNFASMVSNFGYMYSVAAAVATSIIVGHAVGAKEYDFAYERVMKSLRKALFISVAIAGISWLVSPITIGLFTKNPAIIKLSGKVLFICIFLEIGRTANLVIINSMRAAGDVKFPTYLGMASMWGVAVLFGYIFAIKLNMGLVGLWIAMAMDELLRGVVVYIRWKKGGWRNKRVIEE